MLRRRPSSAPIGLASGSSPPSLGVLILWSRSHRNAAFPASSHGRKRHRVTAVTSGRGPSTLQAEHEWGAACPRPLTQCRRGIMLNRPALLVGASALVGAAGVAGAALAIRAKWHSHPSNAVISWLKANALPLASVEPGADFKDLEQLRPLIGDARIVSLGEATHGTREFFQLK